jgi:putative membrane protein
MGTCYLPGIKVDGFAFAMLIAAILTIINIFIKPIIKLITFPINMLSFGIFNMLLNFGILCIVAYYIPQYTIENYLSGFVASVLIAISFCIIKKC